MSMSWEDHFLAWERVCRDPGPACFNGLQAARKRVATNTREDWRWLADVRTSGWESEFAAARIAGMSSSSVLAIGAGAQGALRETGGHCIVVNDCPIIEIFVLLNWNFRHASTDTPSSGPGSAAVRNSKKAAQRRRSASASGVASAGAGGLWAS